LRKTAETSSLLVLALFLWLSIHAQNSDAPAVVIGRVLDYRGQPVAGARISMLPESGFSGVLPSADTNDDGRYRLVSPPCGLVWLVAVKESAGYPDINSLLFAPEVNTRPKVLLAPGSQIEQDIHLGHPFGVMEGSTVDAKTGAVVSTARILMRRDKPESMYSETIRDGHFLYALPPVPIDISITAPGFLPWRYKDAQNGSSKLVLQTDEHRKMKIELIAEK